MVAKKKIGDLDYLATYNSNLENRLKVSSSQRQTNNYRVQTQSAVPSMIMLMLSMNELQLLTKFIHRASIQLNTVYRHSSIV